MRATASVIMETESLSDNQTKVIWSNAGTLKYPVNMMIPMMEKHVVKDMDISLSTLKKHSRKIITTIKTIFVGEISIARKTNFEETF